LRFAPSNLRLTHPTLADIQALLAQVASMLHSGEELMFPIVDVPYVLEHEQQAFVMIAENGVDGDPNDAENIRTGMVIHSCYTVPSWEREPDDSAEFIFDLKDELKAFLEARDNRVYDVDLFKNPVVLKAPEHGEISIVKWMDGKEHLRYLPIRNYEGKDSVVVTIDTEGERHTIEVEIFVEYVTGNWSEANCHPASVGWVR
jgi:hypothetical protein